MNVSGKRARRAPFAETSDASASILSIVRARSRTTGSACTQATATGSFTAASLRAAARRCGSGAAPRPWRSEQRTQELRRERRPLARRQLRLSPIQIGRELLRQPIARDAGLGKDLVGGEDRRADANRQVHRVAV